MLAPSTGWPASCLHTARLACTQGLLAQGLLALSTACLHPARRACTQQSLVDGVRPRCKGLACLAHGTQGFLSCSTCLHAARHACTQYGMLARSKAWLHPARRACTQRGTLGRSTRLACLELGMLAFSTACWPAARHACTQHGLARSLLARSTAFLHLACTPHGSLARRTCLHRACLP